MKRAKGECHISVGFIYSVLKIYSPKELCRTHECSIKLRQRLREEKGKKLKVKCSHKRWEFPRDESLLCLEMNSILLLKLYGTILHMRLWHFWKGLLKHVGVTEKKIIDVNRFFIFSSLVDLLSLVATLSTSLSPYNVAVLSHFNDNFTHFSIVAFPCRLIKNWKSGRKWIPILFGKRWENLLSADSEFIIFGFYLSRKR